MKELFGESFALSYFGTSPLLLNKLIILMSIELIKLITRKIGYNINETKIQTDNGIEFTYNQAKIKKIHPVEEALKKLGIKHHKIQPRTPEHNGKVERSHRNDKYNRN